MSVVPVYPMSQTVDISSHTTHKIQQLRCTITVLPALEFKVQSESCSVLSFVFFPHCF